MKIMIQVSTFGLNNFKEIKNNSGLSCIRMEFLWRIRTQLYFEYILMMMIIAKWKEGRKEGNVLFNDTLNTFYLRLYGVGDMVKDHSDSKRGNPLPPHGLLFLISCKGCFICTIPYCQMLIP